MKLSLGRLATGFMSFTKQNNNNAAIENAVEDSLSRSGAGTDNSMHAALDMNGNTILNYPAAVNPTDLARLLDITSRTDPLQSQITYNLGILTDEINNAETSATSQVNTERLRALAAEAALGYLITGGISTGGLTLASFGAVGNGVADDTMALQRAANSAFPIRDVGGTYKITAPITFTTCPNWIGAGAGSLIIGVGLGASQDMLHMTPSVGWLGAVFKDFLITPDNPTHGRHGLHIDIQTGGYLSHADIYLYTTTFNNGRGLRLTNPNADGLFCSQVGGQFGGGIDLEMSGDSNIIGPIQTYGPNPGITIRALNGAAATLIVSHNSTSAGGALWAIGGQQITCMDCQWEQVTASVVPYSGSPALVFADGTQTLTTGATSTGGSVSCLRFVRCNINSYYNCDAVRIDNDIFVTMENCQVIADSIGASGTVRYHVRGSGTTIDCELNTSRNRWLDYTNGQIVRASCFGFSAIGRNSGAPSQTFVNANLSNGWVTTGVPFKVSYESGVVRLTGAVASGTTTPGTLIGSVTSALAPTEDEILYVLSTNGSTSGAGFITVKAGTGNILTGGLLGNTNLNFSNATYDLKRT